MNHKKTGLESLYAQNILMNQKYSGLIILKVAIFKVDILEGGKKCTIGD